MPQPSALSALSQLMFCTTLIPFVAASLGVRQNPGPEKAQTENVRPLIYFITAGLPGLRWEQRVNPVYPPQARKAGIQGDVSLDVAVDADGSVSSVKPLIGPPLLAAAASDAVRQWRFVPTIRLPAHGTVWVQFCLADTGPAVDDRKYRPDRIIGMTPNSPDYPLTALRRGIQGQVVLEVTIDPNGKISDLRVLKSDSGLLTSAAVELIQRPHHPWRCNAPEVRPCVQRVVINFELNHKFPPRDGPLPIAGRLIQAPADLLMTHWDLAMYPTGAQKKDLEGDVQIKLTLDENGEVADAEILSGPEPLQSAALRAAVRSRFAPPSAAAAEVTLNYHFWLPK